MELVAKIKRGFLEDKWFYIVFGLMIVFLTCSRAAPYILHGPFGFGYDTGIYKKTFEDIKNFSDIFTSQVYILPSFLAWVFNLLHIPMGILLYFVHIFSSVFLAIPLYVLTKEYYGRKAGLVAVMIFSISYVQLFASEFYLYKAVMGAIFMLYAFYYYTKKSKLFYLFTGLLALTQLPQLVLLVFGVGIASLIEFKKNLKFNLIWIGVVIFGILFTFVFAPQHILNAWDVIYARFTGVTAYDMHQAGMFMPFAEFLSSEFILLFLAFAGIVLSFKRREMWPLIFATLFVLFIILGKIFFENRYVMEMELMIIPFASFMVVKILGKFLEKPRIKVLLTIVLLIVSFLGSLYWVFTTYPALSKSDIWALDVIKQKTDAEYVFVTHTFYAPWVYGFTGKTVIAPGIFKSVWDFDEYMKYKNGSIIERMQMLLDLSRKYGKFYLFQGFRERDERFKDRSPLIKEVFFATGSRVYQISPPNF